METLETYNVASMPQQRLDEIEFCNYIKRLITQYNHSVVIYDLIDAFATFSEVTPAIIKNLVQRIYIGDNTLVPSKEEQLVVYRKRGYSMRKIKDITGIHPNTQYSILERLKNNVNERPTLAPKLDEETYTSIKAFMTEIKKFKEV